MPGSLGARDATGQGGRGQHPSCERWRQNALTPVERSARSCSLVRLSCRTARPNDVKSYRLSGLRHRLRNAWGPDSDSQSCAIGRAA